MRFIVEQVDHDKYYLWISRGNKRRSPKYYPKRYNVNSVTKVVDIITLTQPCDPPVEATKILDTIETVRELLWRGFIVKLHQILNESLL